MFNEVVRVSQDRWTHTDELLVNVAQRLDLLFRVTVMSNRDPAKPAPQFGPLFDYPRPGRERKPQSSGPQVVHPRDLARRMLMGGGG